MRKLLNLITFISMPSKKTCLITGLISGIAFAPTFFIPGLLSLSLLCFYIYKSNNVKTAFLLSFIFGFGHFFAGVYWISLGVSVYIEDFWWAIPLALFGIPLILACFTALCGVVSYYFKANIYYHLIFCVIWVFCEWLRSWIFTGLPWNLLGYSLSFSDILIQPASIFGVYGLSFMVIYSSSSLFFALTKRQIDLAISLLLSAVMLSSTIIYGLIRLQQNPTNYLDIKVRIVQPSIPQIAKWDEREFWKNLDTHIKLSTNSNDVDIIIWSEAALVAPYRFIPVKNKIDSFLKESKAILITGGISDNNKENNELQIYTTMYAIAPDGKVVFEYHKSHLVPFGEYMPFKAYIPIKKITHGFLDYTPGNKENVYIKKLNLAIKPLICYESIFPKESSINNKIVDLFINITNDAWYGTSSGPYQHLQQSRMRTVENGLPMLRSANNGISAIIDPVGRVIQSLGLNKIGIIDGMLPKKLDFRTLYSEYLELLLLALISLVLILQFLMKFLLKNYLLNSGYKY